MADPRRPGGPGGLTRPGVPQQFGGPTAPLLEPFVLTIGSQVEFSDASDTVPTSVTLIGSINPQGLAGTWWFTYGTTTSMGTTASAAMPVAATTIPQAITVVVPAVDPTTGNVNLQTGVRYYFAAVGQTAGGLVVAMPLSFVFAAPSVPVTPGTVVQNPAEAALTLPHFEFPFTIVFGTKHAGTGNNVTSNDGAQVVQQDSDGDVLSCVEAIVSCEVGQWPQNPEFGITDQTFKQVQLSPDGSTVEVDALSVASTVARWEPRANARVITQAMQGDTTTGNWTIDVETQGSVS